MTGDFDLTRLRSVSEDKDFAEYLEQTKAAITLAWAGSSTDRNSNLLQGRLLAIQQIIEDFKAVEELDPRKGGSTKRRF
jgi:hypothetical protein